MYSIILSNKRIEERKRILGKLHAKNLRGVKLSMDFQMKEVPESIKSLDSTHLALINKRKANEVQLLNAEPISEVEGETALKLHNSKQNSSENNMEENNANTASEEAQNAGNDHYIAMQAFTWHWNALNYWGRMLSMQGFTCYAAQPTGYVTWAPPVTFLPQHAGGPWSVPQGYVPQPAGSVTPPLNTFRPEAVLASYVRMPMSIPPTPAGFVGAICL